MVVRNVLRGEAYRRIGGALLIVGLLALWPGVAPGQEDDEFQREGPSLGAEESGADLPIAIELAQGVELLNTQITQQQELLKTAQTEREKQLIHSHIRLLQKERRSLESLLHKLVGPNVDLLEDAREQRRELQYEREQKQLEQEQRFPPSQ